MPVYTYSCDACGSFDLVRPMADSAHGATCPTCLADVTRRVFGAPALSTISRGLHRAADAAAASAESPQVVRAVPHGNSRPRPRSTRLPALPRP